MEQSELGDDGKIEPGAEEEVEIFRQRRMDGKGAVTLG